MISDWPQVDTALRNEGAEQRMAVLMEVVAAVRKLRADQGVAPSQRVDISIATDNEDIRLLVAQNEAILLSLTRGEKVTLTGATTEATGEHLFWQEMPVVVTISRELSAEERQREMEKIRREHAKLLGDIEKLEARLASPQFTGKAPEQVVAKTRADLAELQQRRTSLEERLRTLEG
jgi:valyl-tRNA synthetase